MNAKHLLYCLPVLLFGVGAVLSVAGEGGGVSLKPMGRFAVSTARVPGGTTVKIRLAEEASFPGCKIVIAELGEAFVMAGTPGGGTGILREWTLREATSQPVMVYQLTNSAWIGVGLFGTYIEPQEEHDRPGDFQTFSFPAFTDRILLDIKLVAPEF